MLDEQGNAEKSGSLMGPGQSNGHDKATREESRRQGRLASEPKPSSTCSARTILSGVPNEKRRIASVMAVFINVLLTALTLDFIYRAPVLYSGDDVAISRVGYVSSTTAKLLVREPNLENLPLAISYREASEEDSEQWVEEGKIYHLDYATDFTHAITIKNLKPSTQYQYRLSNNKTGSFTTAPMPGSELSKRLTFMTSSCIKPNFPYNPFSHPLRIMGIEKVTQAITNLPPLRRPSFMLFLGDFIYIDVPIRLGSSLEHYRGEYRRVYSSPSWQVAKAQPAADLPWIHTLDDHEIANDWARGNTTPPYPAAADPYAHYHVSVNPPIPSEPFASPENTTYFSFVHGPASIFMLDTRTYRTTPGQANSTILGSAQHESLLAFLARPESPEVKWKIIASSVPFTKNWHVGQTDTWGGFLNERRTILEAMWRAERELGVRVIILSGDRHEFGATRFPDPAATDRTPGTAGHGIHEFSVGPLNMFYLPIRSYRQTDDEDVMVKYAPDGNTKFGMIDIDVTDDNGKGNGESVPHSVLTYSLYIDDSVVWKYQLSIPLADSSSASHLPPGRVLYDDLEKNKFSRRWGFYRWTAGWKERLTVARDDFKDAIAPVLSWVLRKARVD